MKKLRIGIFPFSQDLSHPADRRRLVPWAKKNGHELLINESKNVDFIFISEGADFHTISKIKDVPKIFDLIDGYLTPESPAIDWSRGILKTLLRQHHTYPQKYSSIVADACRDVDVVICSSEEQKQTITKYNNNVHIILDNHSEIPLIPFTAKSQRSFFWEGTTFTINGLTRLLSDLSFPDLPINIVTDENHFRLLGRYFPKKTINLFPKTRSQNVSLWPWTIENLENIARISSLALLPIDTRRALQKMKPENRLLIMFRLGLPCLTGDIASYRRMERVLGIKFVCENKEDWIEGVNRYSSDAEFAENQVKIGQSFIKTFHTEEIIFSKWDKAIQEII